MIAMAPLTHHDLRMIRDTLCRAKQVEKNRGIGLKGLFVENPRLIISPSNRCNGGCLHCVADSVPNGKVMPYSGFVSIDQRFLRLFQKADFGRSGNPISYRSEGHDIADLITFLHQNGINEFSLALAIHGGYEQEVGRLEALSTMPLNIETMVTYHHYFPDLDTAKLARDFNSALRQYMRFSRTIEISLLGDGFLQQGSTMADQVKKSFEDDFQVIFDGMEVTPKGDGVYLVSNKGKKTEVLISPINAKVYPLGRFRQYLSRKGILEQYGRFFEQFTGEYACPDMVNWPGVVIEPDGGLNFCASFEAIESKGAVVSNILSKPFGTVQEDLMRFHLQEFVWFIDNLRDIIDGKVSTCKLKNCCYGQAKR